MKRILVVLVIACMLWSSVELFGQSTSAQSRHSLNVSLIQVIANPSDFNGQHLRVVGYLGPNGIDRAVGIFLSEADGHNFVLSNSIDLRAEESMTKDLIGKYVVFSGTYHAPSSRSGYNGYFDQVLDIRPWNAGKPSR